MSSDAVAVQARKEVLLFTKNTNVRLAILAGCISSRCTMYMRHCAMMAASLHVFGRLLAHLTDRLHDSSDTGLRTRVHFL